MSLLPQKLYTGFPFDLTLEQGEYKASQGFTVKVILRGPQNTELTATAVSDSAYTVSVTAPVDGVYLYTVLAESLTARHLIDTGRIEFLPDPTAVAEGSDLRSHAERTLAAIEAVLEKRATSDQQSYSIAGRSITKIPLTELISLRDKYRAEVATARGKTPRRFLARFAK